MKDNIAAVYCRLSKEDLDKELGKSFSESIKNQKSMLETYALERQWRIYDFYIDEDYSGSDRDRPEFNRLITDSLLGRFSIVLCKKQSRFARDIEYVEKYIHGVFAERQIRFVAVLDNIDTAAVSRSVRKASQINSLVDEWYLSDLSENIISSLNTKRRNAEFIGSWAPYGYCKDPNNKNALIIDPEAAKIVKRIYGLYQKGLGINKIAQELNLGRIANPLLYKQRNGEKINPNPISNTGKRYLWTPSSISSILHNQTYIGHLVQGKYRKASYKSKKLLRVPRSDWIVIPGSHEAIINQETWDDVQKRLASKCRVTAGRQSQHMLAGKVFCGECGSKLVSSGGRTGKIKTTYLCCSKHNLSNTACSGARIQASRLEQLLLEEIRQQSNRYFDEAYLLDHIDFAHSSNPSEKVQLADQLSTLKDRSDVLERQQSVLYADKLEGIITQTLFIEHRDRLNAEAETLLQQQQAIMVALSDMRENESAPIHPAEILDQFKTPDQLTRSMIDNLLYSVFVFQRKKGAPQEITINWMF